ncbi:AbrB family transcriptional regulator [Bacillus niameyensis]|uniref:AbrB family transcriptional regulator n=1 Tax=Bacillus niameyensis TaxID=1522308 RepID=UPI0038993920
MFNNEIIITLVFAIVGGMHFKFLHIPVPWLLGPMLAALVCTVVLKFNLEWPKEIRNTGMIIVGYTIGLSMTPSAYMKWDCNCPLCF